MDFVTIGLCVSVLVVSMLGMLFSYEKRTGVRFLNGFRTSFDFLVLRCAYAIHTTSRRIGSHLIRQIFHYIFHTLMGLILACIRRCEHGLQNMMRANRTLAKSAERDSLNRSKLEEIALHKVASALSEEEKHAHKEKMLNGM